METDEPIYFVIIPDDEEIKGPFGSPEAAEEYLIEDDLEPESNRYLLIRIDPDQDAAVEGWINQ